jgi:hypothetical protein
MMKEMRAAEDVLWSEVVNGSLASNCWSQRQRHSAVVAVHKDLGFLAGASYWDKLFS